MKVRANSVYYYDPNGWDTVLPTANNAGQLKRGDKVRVVNLYGCPPANTMGQCYIVPAAAKKDSRGRWNKPFVMVSTGSLEKKKPANKPVAAVAV